VASKDGLKIAALATGILAGCSAELFHTPSEIRGVWEVEGNGRVLVIAERSLSVYDATGGTCRLDHRQDFAGPLLSEWEVFPAADGQTLRYREPGAPVVVAARRLPEVPDRCVAGS
jgi:hypothetical protein